MGEAVDEKGVGILADALHHTPHLQVPIGALRIQEGQGDAAVPMQILQLPADGRLGEADGLSAPSKRMGLFCGAPSGPMAAAGAMAARLRMSRCEAVIALPPEVDAPGQSTTGRRCPPRRARLLGQ